MDDMTVAELIERLEEYEGHEVVKIVVGRPDWAKPHSISHAMADNLNVHENDREGPETVYIAVDQDGDFVPEEVADQLRGNGWSAW